MCMQTYTPSTHTHHTTHTRYTPLPNPQTHHPHTCLHAAVSSSSYSEQHFQTLFILACRLPQLTPTRLSRLSCYQPLLQRCHTSELFETSSSFVVERSFQSNILWLLCSADNKRHTTHIHMYRHMRNLYLQMKKEKLFKCWLFALVTFGVESGVRFCRIWKLTHELTFGIPIIAVIPDLLFCP